MEINGFRELLLKKAEGNSTLQTLILYSKDELLAEKVLESLEKMARPHASMGRGANAATIAFANSLKNKDVEQIRDALGHHIAHYKAALKAGKRDVADQHLNRIVPMLHLVGKSAAHSGGQLGLDYIPMEPWETNYTKTDRRPETGKLKEGTKGLGRRPKPNSTSDYAVKNYHYLEMQPHGGHMDTKNSKHKGGYPFEEIQVGNPAKIDAGEAYLHIPEVEAKDKFEPHPFDEHPIHTLADIKQDKLTPKHLEDFANAMGGWHEGEHSKRWHENIKEQFGKDPEGFKQRGKVKPAHHFQDIKLQDQPEHARVVEPAPAPAAKVAAPKSAAPGFDVNALPESLRAKFGGNK